MQPYECGRHPKRYCGLLHRFYEDLAYQRYEDCDARECGER